MFDASELKRANVTEVVDIARLTPNFSVTIAGGDATSVLLTIRGRSQRDYILTTGIADRRLCRRRQLYPFLEPGERFWTSSGSRVLKGPQGTLVRQEHDRWRAEYHDAAARSRRESAATPLVSWAITTAETITGVLNLPLISDMWGCASCWAKSCRALAATPLIPREGASFGNKNRNAFRANLLFESGTVRWSFSGDYTREKSNGPIARLAQPVNPYPSPAAGTPNPALGLVEVALEAGADHAGDAGRSGGQCRRACCGCAGASWKD